MAKMDSITELSKVLDKAKGIEHAELKRLIHLCETDEIGILKRQIEMLTLPREKGELVSTGHGRYELNGYEFCCGSYIEVLTEEGWQFGRVEHSNGGYYFYNGSGMGDLPLSAGLTVARRVNISSLF